VSNIANNNEDSNQIRNHAMSTSLSVAAVIDGMIIAFPCGWGSMSSRSLRLHSPPSRSSKSTSVAYSSAYAWSSASSISCGAAFASCGFSGYKIGSLLFRREMKKKVYLAAQSPTVRHLPYPDLGSFQPRTRTRVGKSAYVSVKSFPLFCGRAASVVIIPLEQK
jgi:hypothetical protein